MIYNWQNNRNPLIDLPEIVNYIWGDNFGDVWFNNLNISINQNDFKFYPNPTSGTIVFNSFLDKVDLFSINGQKLSSFYDVRTLDINLKKGLYLIRLYKNGNTSNHKIIIK